MAVQYMQMLKVDEIIKMGDDQNLNNFMEAITKPLNINQKFEEYSKFNKDIMKLYLMIILLSLSRFMKAS